MFGDTAKCECHSADSRNLIVCIDGTANQFGEKNTNVIELYNLISKGSQHNQRTWYNSGIGTYARPHRKSLSYYVQAVSHKIDLAVAWNFERTVIAAYRWLSDNYEEGDRIFLFGFSRGAFQVRVLSAMIDKVGLIYKGNEMQIPFAYELYADPNSDLLSSTEVGTGEDTYISKAERFKRAFSDPSVRVHFVGVWDTVSSIGVARGKKTLPGTTEGMTHVCYFRHALALDERRVKFLPEYAWGGSPENLVWTPKSAFEVLNGTGEYVEEAKTLAEIQRSAIEDVWSPQKLLEAVSGTNAVRTPESLLDAIVGTEDAKPWSPPSEREGLGAKNRAWTVRSMIEVLNGSKKPVWTQRSLLEALAGTRETRNVADINSKFPHTVEVWFAGTHSDIGGGNRANEGMDRSRPPLRWMVLEANAAGLRTSPFKRELSSEEQVEFKESLVGFGWKLFESLPFKRLTYTRESIANGGKQSTRWPHFGASRKIHPGQKIHSSFVLAQQGDHYVPKARPPGTRRTTLQGSRDKWFWRKLHEDGLRNMQGWFEVDLLQYAQTVMKTYVEGRANFDKLAQIETLGLGPGPVEKVVLEAIGGSDIPSDPTTHLLSHEMSRLVADGYRSRRDSVSSGVDGLHPWLEKSTSICARTVASRFLSGEKSFDSIVEIGCHGGLGSLREIIEQTIKDIDAIHARASMEPLLELMKAADMCVPSNSPDSWMMATLPKYFSFFISTYYNQGDDCLKLLRGISSLSHGGGMQTVKDGVMNVIRDIEDRVKAKTVLELTFDRHLALVGAAVEAVGRDNGRVTPVEDGWEGKALDSCLQSLIRCMLAGLRWTCYLPKLTKLDGNLKKTDQLIIAALQDDTANNPLGIQLSAAQVKIIVEDVRKVDAVGHRLADAYLTEYTWSVVGIFATTLDPHRLSDLAEVAKLDGGLNAVRDVVLKTIQRDKGSPRLPKYLPLNALLQLLSVTDGSPGMEWQQIAMVAYARTAVEDFRTSSGALDDLTKLAKLDGGLSAARSMVREAIEFGRGNKSELHSLSLTQLWNLVECVSTSNTRSTGTSPPQANDMDYDDSWEKGALRDYAKIIIAGFLKGKVSEGKVEDFDRFKSAVHGPQALNDAVFEAFQKSPEEHSVDKKFKLLDATLDILVSQPPDILWPLTLVRTVLDKWKPEEDEQTKDIIERERRMDIFLQTCTDLCYLIAAQPTSTPIALSPDGKRVLAPINNEVREWSLWHSRAGANEGTPMIDCGNHAVCSIAMLGNDRWIVSGLDNGQILIKDRRTGVLETMQAGNQRRVVAFAVCNNGSGTIAIQCDDKGVVSVWRLDPYEVADSEPGDWATLFRRFSRRILVGDRTRIEWRIRPLVLEDASSQPLDVGLFTSISTARNSRVFATGSSDKLVRIWDSVRGNVLGTMEGHTEGVSCVAVSPGGDLIASGSSDKTIRVWSAEAPYGLIREIRGHDHAIRSLTFSPDGTRIISASDDHTVGIWGARDGVEIKRLRGHKDVVLSAVVSSEGKRIVSVGKDGMREWDGELALA
ncbi:hypothetical protein FA15DRAFT_697596 [Coprinopsis marcescibilis]|uniref:T6SS Phospholipase effector Tle1-like catalytic domain-containing protein n=1 Tax=Coprinopsis marcescibilis TaxID=230819 RepID=A0A5C3KHU2_COPMA|nr:hypothetical protein FA15DRAFT_697596 [Coprinopsis marcescibilis]